MIESDGDCFSSSLHAKKISCTNIFTCSLLQYRTDRWNACRHAIIAPLASNLTGPDLYTQNPLRKAHATSWQYQPKFSCWALTTAPDRITDTTCSKLCLTQCESRCSRQLDAAVAENTHLGWSGSGVLEHSQCYAGAHGLNRKA